MSVLPHSHFLSLPPKVSKSGERPSMRARIWFVVLGVFIVFALSNAVIASITEGVIYPGVSVAGKDLSFKTKAEAREILAGLKTERNFTVQVGDKSFAASSSDLGAKYDLETTLDLAYESGHSTPLPLLGFFDVNKSGQLGYAYWINQDQLKSFTSKVVSAVGRDPINATIKVVDGNLEVVPDQDGFRVDQKVLTSLIQTSIADGKDQNLRLEPGYVKAPLLAKDLDAAKNRAEELLNHNIVLTYDGKQFVPDRKAKGYWLTFTHEQKQDGNVSLVVGVSREQVLGYLQSVANQVDVAPINKKITVVNGSETVEREGQDGKAINQEPAADQIVSALASNQGATITLSSRPLAYGIEKKRIGNCSSQDGGKVIEVNLSSQTLIACQDGQVIFSTPITSGATGAGFPTVTGQFAIYAKERSRYLNGAQYGYNYNVYVDYWMPFTGGYGLHDADWRSAFGGQDYYYGGSHGCVNMPKSSAAFLFGWAPVGTPVWVHY